MLTFPTDIATLLTSHCEFYWLAELALPGGTVYLSDSKQITWGGHTWLPLLDRETPHDGIKYNLRCDESNETAIHLVNVNHAVSDLLKTNDFQGCSCIIYLYFPAASSGAGNAIERFRGTMGKPEEETDTVIVVPVTSRLHGPRTKLPSRVFASTCGLVFPEDGDGAETADCPYNPTAGRGVVDPGTSLPYTYCPKTSAACTARGMRAAGTPAVDYFGGFEKWTCISHGKLNNSGYYGLGRHSYTSRAEIQDNFFNAAVPLVYGKIRVPGIVYFHVDESEFLLVGAFVGEGQMMGCTKILANNQETHDFQYPPLLWGGYPGQLVPGLTGYVADPFCCTTLAIIRIKDEVGIQADRMVDVSVRLADPANHASDLYGGRMVESYYYDGGVLKHVIAFSNDPLDIVLDMLCAARGGLGFDYASVNYTLLNTDRGYSGATITDWDGVSRERYTFNAYIADQQPAGDTLEQFRNEFNMVVQDYGSTITLRYIRPTQTSVATFDAGASANILHDDDGLPRLVIKEKPIADIPNRLVVSFLDQDNNWEKTTFHLESQTMIERAGKIVDEQIFLRATTNIGQAMRIASNKMEKYVSGNWDAEWAAPPSALAVECGDVVTLTDDKIIDGGDDFLVTSVEISADLEIQFAGELFRSDFYDDVVDDEYADHTRGAPDNPMRLPAEVLTLAATETIVQVDGANTSEVNVTWTYPAPPDPLLQRVEIWYRDTLSPTESWIQAAVSTSAETSAKFTLPIHGYRMLEIRARAVSRYGICRDLDNVDVPEYDLLVDGTMDDNVPDAPVSFAVTTRSTDPTIPPGFYRAKFDAGTDNWNGVHTIYIEANETLPFSDGSVVPSGMQPVSGTGVIDAGGVTIFKSGAAWTPHDSSLVGCLAIVTDGGGNVQARYVADNTADTIISNGPWYLPDGSYSFEVRTDFTKTNYRGFLFAANQGDFSPASRSYQFDLPLTDLSLYFRVTAFNAFGKSPWVTTVAPVSNYAVDTTPAALVTGFTVTPQGYSLPGGGQAVSINVAFTPPSPAENFSHIIVGADRPIGSIPGKEGESGWVLGAGYYKELIGEIWEAGTPVILEPSAVATDSAFFAISVNKDGWYPTDWVTTGEDNLGGYRRDDATIIPEDTAPPASASVVATFNPGAGVNVVWDAISIPDMDYWEVEMRKATTEGGLAAASYVAQSETRSTLHQHFTTQDDNGYWFQFRVRAIDNTANQGTWAESNNVQAYAGASVTPVAVPLNLGASGAWAYHNGVPFAYLTITWDDPVDANYGGAEVWIIYPSDAYGELYDRVGYLETSQTMVVLPMLGQLATVRLVPYNRSGVVPDYATYVESASFTLAQATFGETVPAPNLVARDGVGRVSIESTIPPWSGMQKPYANLCLYISATNNSATSHLIGKWPVGHASASNEIMHLEVPFDALANVAGGPYTTGTLYYFWAKLESSGGAQSDYSVDTDFSAVFIAGNLTDSGAADFAAGAEVLRIAASDKMIFAAWNAPTVNGTTVYLSELQVATATTFAAASLVEDFTINAQSGSKGVGLPINGTYYLRVRYLNNSPAGWSEWFGLVEGGTAYATVRTQADQTGDTSYIDGATYITGYKEDIVQQDALRIYFKMSSSATNCATWYNVTALWSDTESKLSDDTAGYLVSSPTLTWLDNDSWISTGATTPATTWIGKLLQYRYNASPNLWISGIITQVDITNKKVQLNVNWGAAKTSQTGRVITPYWQREGVYFKEVGEDNGWHLEKNVNYYLPPINQFVGDTTVYFKLTPHNIFGPGTSEDFSQSNGDLAKNIVDNGQGYASGTAPTGSFASYGGQWFVLPNGTATRQVTFSYTQATSVNEKADCFIVVVKVGGGTPDPAVDQKYVFPTQHTSGAQNYKLDVNGLDPFVTYAFRLYAGKTCASGVIFSSSYQSTSDTSQNATDNLALKPKTLTGHVRTETYNSTDLTTLHCSGIAEDNFNEYVSLNDSTATTEIAADGTIRLSAADLDFQAGDVICGAAKPIYFGSSATDGTWKIVRSGNDLIFQRRESGSYVTKHTITA